MSLRSAYPVGGATAVSPIHVPMLDLPRWRSSRAQDRGLLCGLWQHRQHSISPEALRGLQGGPLLQRRVPAATPAKAPPCLREHFTCTFQQ
mmetsp:Transcript_6570/g.13124  ORF Transcript_6570/g.13124 Transcript_6570/m.13124 type:complete len:91 (-) Transcript_6570:164-436(-)